MLPAPSEAMTSKRPTIWMPGVSGTWNLRNPPRGPDVEGQRRRGDERVRHAAIADKHPLVEVDEQSRRRRHVRAPSFNSLNRSAAAIAFAEQRCRFTWERGDS